MREKYEYYTYFGWTHNPFTLTISPQLMVGYSSHTNELLSHIFNIHKIALVIGHTGSGKTTILTWIEKFINNSGKNFRAFYIPKPPIDKDDLISLFKSFFGYNIIDNFRFRDMKAQILPKYLIKKTLSKKYVLLIDESHEASIEVLEWLRTLADMVPNLLIVFAGLPSFEQKIETNIPTLGMRITTKIYLTSLDSVETESLIRKRIEDAGGNNLKPFTDDSIKRIYEITGGFPREIIKVCDKLVRSASEKNIASINQTFVNSIFTDFKKEIKINDKKDYQLSIPEKQKDIMKILLKNPGLSPNQIVENIDKKSYKNTSNAIRSVNNILKRMMREDLIERTKVSNTYLYSLSGKGKSLMADA